LQLKDIEFWYAEETGLESFRDECCPGKPHILFTKGIMLRLDNPQRQSGMYQRTLLIENGVTVQSVIDKIAVQLKTLGDKVIVRKYSFVITFLYYLAT